MTKDPELIAPTSPISTDEPVEPELLTEEDLDEVGGGAMDAYIPC